MSGRDVRTLRRIARRAHELAQRLGPGDAVAWEVLAAAVALDLLVLAHEGAGAP